MSQTLLLIGYRPRPFLGLRMKIFKNHLFASTQGPGGMHVPKFNFQALLLINYKPRLFFMAQSKNSLKPFHHEHLGPKINLSAKIQFCRHQLIGYRPRPFLDFRLKISLNSFLTSTQDIRRIHQRKFNFFRLYIYGDPETINLQ